MKWEKQEGSSIWLPEKEGEEMIGEVKNINTEGLYGNQYSIETEKGAYLTPSHKVLQNRMVNVSVGDKVKIVYVGEEPPAVRGQNPTKMYEVYKEA